MRNISIQNVERGMSDSHRKLSECQRRNCRHLQDVILKNDQDYVMHILQMTVCKDVLHMFVLFL